MENLPKPRSHLTKAIIETADLIKKSESLYLHSQLANELFVNRRSACCCDGAVKVAFKNWRMQH